MCLTTHLVLNRLREQLNSRGAKTVRGLGRTFRIMDSLDGNRKVDSGEFFTSLNEMGVRVSKPEAEVNIHFDLSVGFDDVF